MSGTFGDHEKSHVHDSVVAKHEDFFKLPAVVKVDNVKAICMAGNITKTNHMKHVDIKYKYVNEYVEDWIEKIAHVQSTENDSDILTRSLSGDLHEKHSKNIK